MVVGRSKDFADTIKSRFSRVSALNTPGAGHYLACLAFTKLICISFCLHICNSASKDLQIKTMDLLICFSGKQAKITEQERERASYVNVKGSRLYVIELQGTVRSP
ncbi:hypothetical protein V6N13_119493 [Hibiscus sabdariffa]|uniref:Uncharacterized protein n=1 Tax=Hibiscus sabdariffa TaxID=183260 RepID=A0ABR2E1F5_9ROSI